MMKSREQYLNGQLLLIDKPHGWSSFQAVNSIRWAIRRKFSLKKIKVGHAGTLDPLATGLLLVCTGKLTKEISRYQGMNKEYTGECILGATTPSFDLETPIDHRFPIEHLTEQQLKETAAGFIGNQQQIPPIFSAIKKDGKRLYTYARDGNDIDLLPREVVIQEFEITAIRLPVVTFRVVCQKGTYIRSLIHDFGKAVHSGAHLSSLRRTKIGDYNVNKAWDPLEFQENLMNQEAL